MCRHHTILKSWDLSLTTDIQWITVENKGYDVIVIGYQGDEKQQEQVVAAYKADLFFKNNGGGIRDVIFTGLCPVEYTKTFLGMCTVQNSLNNGASPLRRNSSSSLFELTNKDMGYVFINESPKEIVKKTKAMSSVLSYFFSSKK